MLSPTSPTAFESVPMPSTVFSQVSKRYAGRTDGRFALRGVSFTAEPGEAIGILGRNGSGKSTLLKLAAGVTKPTSGTVEIARPAAPMLELGAGFHPDLSGRDNVQLNGSLLGLGRRIDPEVFRQIVRFAELEDHIEEPVKHYSSGMYARLGFAIAVHSPAKVLLIDEVLSVGDALFRHKCLERIRQMLDGGVTILLVTHDPWIVATFCTRALVIDAGELLADAAPADALRLYNETLQTSGEKHQDGPGWISDPRLENPVTGGVLELLSSEDLRLKFRFDLSAAPGPCHFVARVVREDGTCCGISVSTSMPNGQTGEASLDMSGLRIVPGRYFAHISVAEDKYLMTLAEADGPAFAVPDADGKVPLAPLYRGVVRMDSSWRISGESS
jgi:lipopolysaccharide transport system ATP-binding protein